MGTEHDDRVVALAGEYWDDLLGAYPRTATLLGDRRFDDQVEDLRAGAEVELLRRWERRLADLDAVDPADLGPGARVTHALLRGDLARDIEGWASRLTELASNQMDGIHAQLLTEVPQLSAPTPEAAAALAARHRRLGTLFDQALDRFRAGLATGRTPARLTLERSLRQIDVYLASPLDSDPFVTLDGPEGWTGERGWRDELAAIAREVIRPAFARYREMLATELVPAARDDEHCGLSWLGDDGEALYQQLIRHHTTVDDLSAAEIHEIGRNEIERLADEGALLGERLFGLTDASAVSGRLRDDPALRYGTADEILADARHYLDAAGAAMGAWFGRLPRAGCVVEAVPDFLAADAPSAYYFPPPADGSRPGTYRVNLRDPGTRTRFETAAVAYHESIPGHHLQLAIAGELDHLPSFQRFSWANTAFVEGWALYAERLADEMGLYRDDLERMGMLAADLWRSARLVVDTGLHALGWSRRRAIEYMAAHVPVGLEEIEVEVDRYVAIPGQALGYKIGQLEIQRLRAEAERRQDGAFDIRAFHDTVLGSGSVSLTVLRRLVHASLPADPAA